MEIDLHPVTEKITSLLREHGFWFETFLHEAVRTSEEAAALRPDYSIEQGAKALIVRVKNAARGKHFVMLVLPGGARFDNGAVKTTFGFSDIRFATEAEVADITGGILPGGVPPFGPLFGLEVYLDDSLLKHERIIFNAGDRRFSVGMSARDYLTLVQPVVAQFVAA